MTNHIAWQTGSPNHILWKSGSPNHISWGCPAITPPFDICTCNVAHPSSWQVTISGGPYAGTYIVPWFSATGGDCQYQLIVGFGAACTTAAVYVQFSNSGSANFGIQVIINPPGGNITNYGAYWRNLSEPGTLIHGSYYVDCTATYIVNFFADGGGFPACATSAGTTATIVPIP